MERKTDILSCFIDNIRLVGRELNASFVSCFSFFSSVDRSVPKGGGTFPVISQPVPK